VEQDGLDPQRVTTIAVDGRPVWSSNERSEIVCDTDE